jgi:hypothetical protein
MAMDVAGARALEQRIAEGKPVDDAQPPHLPQLELPLLVAPLRQALPDAPEVEVVYLQPRALPSIQRAWVYVRGPDGRLRRAR